MTATESNSAAKSENLNDISAYNPLTEPKTDLLGYAPFAKHLAESICQMKFPGGFVIAVYGSSGAGKSTLLNFIVHYLKQKPENEQPIVIPFNPWLFSGHQDIPRRFIDQLQSVLTEWKSVPKGLRDRIADFGQFVSKIPLPYTQAGEAVATIFDNQQKDTSDLKEEVEHELQQQHPRIVVTIDDIDRLTAEEIGQLFRVVTSIPNFTDVVYLLACDREVVVKALAQTQGISGEAYLEKIVQVHFELPHADKTLLRKLLFAKLSAVLADTPKQLLNQTRWGNLYYQGIDHFIINPRDIVRLTNNLSVAYPAVKGEVNPVDFIAVESLRVFCPMMYNIIRKNSQAFAGHADDKSFLDSSGDELKRLHNSWIAQVQEQDKQPVKRLLLHLFPKLQAVWGNTYHDVEHELWRRQLRVCSLEVFPIYFRLALSEGELSNTEMKAILALAKDTKAFGETLIAIAEQKRPDGTTQVRAFLERLEDYTATEIAGDDISSIVQALFDVGDRLLRPEDEPYGMFDFGNDVRIDRIIWQLLRRQDEPLRFEMLKQAISSGNALSTIVRELVTCGQQQGKYGADQPGSEEEWLLTAQHLKELEELTLKRVQAAAEQNSLLQRPGLPQILYAWQDWASQEEVKQWVHKAIGNDEGLVEFLEKFVGKTITQSVSDMVPKKTYKLDLEQLEPFLEPSSVSDRVRSLDEKNGLTEERATAIKQFIQEYDTRQQEKDSDES